MGAYATSVGLYRSNWLTATTFSMRWIGIFTTATDCAGNFVWTLPTTSPKVLTVEATETIYTINVSASISDCAISYPIAVQSNSNALPSYMVHKPTDGQLIVTVDTTATLVIYELKFTAIHYDKVTPYKSEDKLVKI